MCLGSRRPCGCEAAFRILCLSLPETMYARPGLLKVRAGAHIVREEARAHGLQKAFVCSQAEGDRRPSMAEGITGDADRGGPMMAEGIAGHRRSLGPGYWGLPAFWMMWNLRAGR